MHQQSRICWRLSIFLSGSLGIEQNSSSSSSSCFSSSAMLDVCVSPCWLYVHKHDARRRDREKDSFSFFVPILASFGADASMCVVRVCAGGREKNKKKKRQHSSSTWCIFCGFFFFFSSLDRRRRRRRSRQKESNRNSQSWFIYLYHQKSMLNQGISIVLIRRQWRTRTMR